MTTIPIEAQVSTDQLLRAVEQMPPEEFAAFLDHLLRLRAQRREPHLNQQETALLLQINQGIDRAVQRRFDELVAKRREEQISLVELEELIRITVAFRLMYGLLRLTGSASPVPPAALLPCPWPSGLPRPVRAA